MSVTKATLAAVEFMAYVHIRKLLFTGIIIIYIGFIHRATVIIMPLRNFTKHRQFLLWVFIGIYKKDRGNNRIAAIAFDVSKINRLIYVFACRHIQATGQHIVLTVINIGFHLVSFANRSEEHTSELQSRFDLVCRL